jgi:hypothetical protein
MVRYALAVVAFGVVVGASDEARAQCVAGQAVITTCHLDLVVGPVLSSSRIVGLGGAYAGIAEGIEGYTSNAAAPAARVPWSHDWMDEDIDLGISFPSAFRSVDFENRGAVSNFTYSDFYFATLGAGLQLGAWGFGATSDLQTYQLTPNAAPTDPSFSATVSKTHLLLARQLFGGEIVAGVGARIVGFSFGRTDPGASTSTTVASLSGTAPEVGVLIRPTTWPIRIGATFRAPVNGVSAPNGATTINGMIVPQSANLPWELELGLAWSLGPRPLNPRWDNPHDDEAPLARAISDARAQRDADRRAKLASLSPIERRAAERAFDLVEKANRADEDRSLDERRREVHAIHERVERALPRELLMVSASLLVTGTTDDGISLESYFRQVVTRAGESATYSPRLGLESELVPNLFRARLGSYIEPTRFGSTGDASARAHATAGFDLVLFRWSVFGIFDRETRWRLTTTIDLAPRWSNYGLAIGAWH